MSEPGDDMMSIEEVCRFFGGSARPLHSSTIYRWVREGKLPEPMHVGPQTTRWLRSEVVATREQLKRKRS